MSRAKKSCILGVIPARGGSKGFPGKNIALLKGSPLIVHTIRAAMSSATLSDFLITTDDKKIAQISRKAGASVPFLRPAEMAKDKSSVWPAVRHAVEFWEKQHARRADIVVLLQPTSPLRTSRDIDGCVERFRQLKADICCSATQPHDSPYFNMVEITKVSAPFARPCSSLMMAQLRRQEAKPVYSLNGAVYVVRRKILSRLVNQYRLKRFAVYEMPFHRSVDVDHPHDLLLAKFWLSHQ